MYCKADIAMFALCLNFDYLVHSYLRYSSVLYFVNDRKVSSQFSRTQTAGMWRGTTLRNISPICRRCSNGMCPLGRSWMLHCR